jgi:uncharacterized protein (TIGR02266 family)
MAQDTRKDPRAKVLTLTVRYKSATVDEFIEHHSHDVSRGGMFIKTPSPFPPGTLLKFEIKISDERAVVQGVGRVVWKRETTQTTADLPAGMGVKFIKLDESSRSLIDRLVASKPEGAASAYESDPAARERPSGPGQPPAPSPSLASARKGTIIGLGSPMKGDFSSLVPTNEPGFFPAQDGPPQQPPLEERTVMKQATELLQEALKDTSGSVVTEAPLFESSPPPSRPSTPGRPSAPSATPAPGYAPSAANAFAPTAAGPSFSPSHAAPAPHSPSFAPTPAAPTQPPFGAPAPFGAPSAAPPFAAQSPHAPAFGAPAAATPFALTPAPPPAFAGSPGMPSNFGGQPSYGSPGGPPHGFNPGGPPVGAQPADPYGSRARSLPPAAPTPSSGSSGRIFIFAGLVAVAGVGVWFASRSLLGGGSTDTPPAVTATAEPSAEPTPPASASADPSAPASASAPDAPASAPPTAPSAPTPAASGDPPAPATSASTGAPAASVPTGAASGAPSSSAGGTAGATGSTSTAGAAGGAVAPVVKTPTVPRPRKPPPTTTTPTSTTTSTEEKKPPPSEGGSDDKKPAPIDNGDNPY